MQLRQWRQPPGLVVKGLATHQEQVGTGQACHPYSRFRQVQAQHREWLAGQGRELGHVADGHASPPAMLLCTPRHLHHGHAFRVKVEIQMQVQVAVVAHRQFEQAADLPVRVAVHVGAAAQHAGTAFQSLTQQGFSPWIVQQAFLGEHADLQADRPGIIRLQPAYGIEPGQADLRVQFHVGAHVRGALQYRLIQHQGCAPVHIVFGELCLRGPGLRYGFGQRAFVQPAALHDAGLVQMDVGFNQARQHEPAAQVQGLPLTGVGAEGCDEVAVLDIQHAGAVIVTQPCVDDFHGVHALTPSPR